MGPDRSKFLLFSSSFPRRSREHLRLDGTNLVAKFLLAFANIGRRITVQPKCTFYCWFSSYSLFELPVLRLMIREKPWFRVEGLFSPFNKGQLVATGVRLHDLTGHLEQLRLGANVIRIWQRQGCATWVHTTRFRSRPWTRSHIWNCRNASKAINSVITRFGCSWVCHVCFVWITLCC